MNSLKKRFKLIAVFFVVFLGVGLFIIFELFKGQDDQPVSTEISKSFQQIVLGQSVEGRNIDAYIFGNGESQLLFVGGIHGGYEWNTIVLAYDFIDYLKENLEFIPENLSIAVIPNMNPDGTFKAIGKDGRLILEEILEGDKTEGRFNANKVDLNRNFDNNWKSEAVWRQSPVNAGAEAFSEPEAVIIRDYVLENNPVAVVFWHSQASAVYSSNCNGITLDETLEIVDEYANASGYSKPASFTAYEITGDATDWMACNNIPAISVELKTHETIEWEENLAGVKAIIDYYKNKELAK